MIKYFKRQKELIEENKKLRRQLESSLDFSLRRINELEQHKTYYIYVDDYDSAKKMIEFINRIKTKSLFTIPNIIILSKDIKIKESDKNR